MDSVKFCCIKLSLFTAEFPLTLSG